MTSFTPGVLVCGVYIQRSFDREKVRIMGMGGEGVVYSNYVVGQKVSLLYSKLIFLASDPASWPQGSILCTQLQPCDGETI